MIMDFMSITESTYEYTHLFKRYDVVCYNVGIYETNQERKKEDWENFFLNFLQEITKDRWIDRRNNGYCLKETFNFKFTEADLPTTEIENTPAQENPELVKGSRIANGDGGINKNNFHLALLKRMSDLGWELKDFAELPERHWTFQTVASITSSAKRKLEKLFE